jgi:uncharacterized delta-60 repeat protein
MLKIFTNQKNNSAEMRTSVSVEIRRALTILMAALILSVGFLTRAEAAAGDLDASFGAGGKVVTDLFGEFDGVVSVLVQSDGKIVAVGNAGVFCAAVRYDNLGNRDLTFGDGGMALIGFDGGLALDAAMQADDRIVIVGRGGGIDSFADFAIARLDANGTVDATFNGGAVVLAHLTDDFDAATAVAIQADGKIVVAGRAFGTGASADFGIVRYTAAGVLDGGFGAGGIVITDFFGDKDGASDIKIQTDGKIVVAGDAKNGAVNGYALARYDADGHTDATFGTGGKVFDGYGGNLGTGNALAIQTDGKIVVAGRSGSLGANANFGVARYDTFGVIDAAFGIGGTRLIDFYGDDEAVSSVVLQPDGKLIVGGTIKNASATLDFGLARLDADGNLDAGFGTGGKVSTDFFGFDDGAGSLFVQTDGKILLGGFANNGSETDFALARYDAAATIVVSNKCPLGHGYWKNHPEAWTVDSLTLGNQTYDKTELVILLGDASKTDASIILARQLIAAKLNLANGSDAAPISAVIAHADAVLSNYNGKLPLKIKPSSDTGQAMVADAAILDDYNRGLLTLVCAP